jgi:D-alanine transaminase
MQVFLNGQLLEKQEAKVSVLDRGFIFGDGVYEVIPVYTGRLFRFTEHLERLQNSLDAIDISNPYSHTEWNKICDDVIASCPGDADKSVYIQVTRGVSDRQHLYPDNITPTVFVMCNLTEAHSYHDGVMAITHEDIRWHRCDIKAITLLPNIMLRQLARNSGGAYEAILVRNNRVTEGAASNVFMVKDGVVYTTPKDGHILPGITRDLVVELLQASGQGILEQDFSLQELKDADEVWLTGSTTGVAPVIQIDGDAVSDGCPGQYWRNANNLFNQYIEKIKT